MSEARQSRKYTYAEAESLHPDQRFEVISGDLFLMSPASPRHQTIAKNLTVVLGAQMMETGDKCNLFPAPTGLFLSKEDAVKENVGGVEPDLFVICDFMEMGSHIVGVPALIVEILSPSSIRHDRFIKLNLYQSPRVPMYWIVDPGNECIEVYVLDGASYKLEAVYTKERDDVLEWTNGNHLYRVALQSVFS